MPDGSRKRRHSPNAARSRWYAQHRSVRFRRRFGLDQKTGPKTEITVTATIQSGASTTSTHAIYAEAAQNLAA